ncbi:probable pseudouridine-5'-phosphatase isoform X1 [Drosophila sulfurigaster albostrigata]|uniref:Probable pseudouridine-5'-phosphatase isoform X1 n=1 Tax=Drosophila albomicans TaxID=7291 RepID=A0A6P8XM53_DROAB|nr:probable pseudouridine-5'-phosphatase isoform X1 [Drosophila albomicans]XP_034099602.1 probable pseudouridine-5'-phosphatase isoform X1 [Drosophila albomicans]XP_060644959.1 probable pseudouridine-5'-phosphatase isoform X1 [Drosophila nasuta]XP_060644962.1 probable pseudouridine-5'-phosphatase isoform X1 [Drosophila nasuta]XP_062142824.1 probable pseudouridine-5'-phosphatase isoform X1 [Drosophila sulfurigaster albostrigata]XP_062142826.1 probable pseudouridine-5'-phosphatase isoform X1 [Dr
MAQKVLRNVTHCIFDMDGLLLDTETLYTLAAQMVLDPYGKTYTFEAKQQLMGLQTRPMAEFMVKYYDLPISWEEYAKQQLENTRTLMGDAKLMPGAERLLRHLHANKVPFALATSSGAEMVELKTRKHRELFDLFNHRVCGSSDKEVKNGKPAPDIFLIAADRFADKPEPANCLVFEDSPNGVTAGESAGMQVIMVPDSRLSPDRCSHATQVLSSLEDFQPELFGLPPFKN